MASPAVQCPSLTLEQASQFIELLFSVPLAIFSIVCFTYGFYTLLFIASLYVLSLNKHTGSGQKIFHITSSTVLFILVSALVACRLSSEGIGLFNLWKLVLVPALAAKPPSDVNNALMLSVRLQSAGQWMFTFTNTAAEIILIHRTFVVWGSDIKVIVAPVILMLANLGTGIASRFIPSADVTQTTGTEANSGQTLHDSHSIVFSGVFLGVNAFTNLVLTGLIAGRIWYISHKSAKYSSTSSSSGYMQKYHSIIAIILESGLLYPTFLILEIILVFGKFPMKDRLNVAHAGAIVSDLLALVAAIAPTLIIVRAGLGITIEHSSQYSSREKPSGPFVFSSNTPLSTFHAHSGGGRNTTTFSDSVNNHERLDPFGMSEQPSRIEGIVIHKVRSTESCVDDGYTDTPAQTNGRHWGRRNGENGFTKSQTYHYRKSAELLA